MTAIASARTAGQWLIVLILVLLASIATPALSQDARDRARDREISEVATKLSALDEALLDGAVDDPAAFADDVRSSISAARALLAPVEIALRRAEESLALLGAAPKEGEPGEAPLLAADRKALTDRVAYFQGQRTRLQATIDEGARVLAALTQQRLEARYSRILHRGAPLIAPSLWASASAEAAVLGGKLSAYLTRWGKSREDAGGALLGILGIVIAFGFSALMVGPARAWARRAFTARIEAYEPTPARRVAVAGVRTLARVLPGIIGGFVVIETARAVGLLAQDGIGVARAVWGALVAYLIVDGFSAGILSPSAPAWRLASLDAARARTVSMLVLAIVLIVGAKAIFVAITQAAGDASAAARLATGICALVVGALLFALCLPGRTTGTPPDMNAADKRSAWPALRLAGRILGVTIGAAAIAGHVNLADFAATRLYYLTLLAAIVWFARAALREAAAWADRKLRAGRSAGPAAQAGSQPFAQPDAQPGAFNFWVGAGVDVALALMAAPALFLLAGVEWSAVRDTVLRALVGFRVGGTVISFADIVFGAAAFVGILALTRVLQGGLQRGPLAHSRMDPGVQNSLVTLFGYAGLVVAAAVALSTAGVDLSNLALIAGALSVGIGFGLQSIVNNFVSGLILLFERPIKVGDWIVTTSGEGIVKKISVRSTEIETFDRSSIIIPNSELVASTVTNLTHKNNVGRIRIPVGVSYDCDPERVREILLDCAEANPLVVRYPEPFVTFEAFGASALEFELRAFLNDIGKGLQARTELRYAIFKAFKAEGIEIPFPQQVVYNKRAPAAARPRTPVPSAPDSAPPRFEPETVDVPDD